MPSLIDRRPPLAMILACMLLLALGAASPERAASAPATPIIRSAAEIDYPPFSFADAQGRADGFAVELLRAALHAMRRDVSFRTGPWPEVRALLERGEIAALPIVGRTPEREPLYDFTFPYMTLHGAIVVRDADRAVRTLDDLAGRRVAVMAGDNAEEFLRRSPRNFSIGTTESFLRALRDLEAGRCDAVVAQRLVVTRLLAEHSFSGLRVVEHPIDGFRQDFCFAVHKGDAKTLALLNEGLAVVVADGTHRRLHAKWFAAMELPSKRRILVGGDRNYAPFEYLDETGHPAGFNVDLTRALAARLGIEVEIRLAPWAETLSALERGEIDAMSGVFYSAERDKVFDFSPPYLVNHCVAVTRRGERLPPATMAELAGLTLAVERGDFMETLARKHGHGDRIEPFDSQAEALRAVVDGRRDCALVARLVALHAGREHGWTDELDFGPSLYSGELCVAVHPGQQALLAQFSEGIKDLVESGELRVIRDRWFGPESEPRAPLSFAEILRASVWIAGPLALLLLVSFLWSRALRARVEERTRELRERIDALKRAEEARERLQSQLLQAQKMESVGRLAGGVAHDFNNMLGVILGHVEFALQEAPPSGAFREDLEEIRKAATRSADLTRQLLAFARKQTYSPVPLDLNRTVEGMLKMLRRLIREEIDLTFRAGEELWPVEMDPGQVDQLLANLCVNASDAIPGEGSIVIETGNLTVGDGRDQPPGFAVAERPGPGDYVRLAVRDTGCGIDESVRAHLFEPFFTTKEVGRGTGLGLATVYGIVKQNGGFVLVESAPGEGSTFTIFLPRGHRSSADPSPDAPAAAERNPAGARTVLVVEDEAWMRRMCVQMLDRLGYRALAAASGEEALSLAAAHAGGIDLLLTDVIMSGMNGKELAGRMRALRPGVRTLFMSGYTADAIALHGVLEPGLHFLQKPFSMEELRTALREACPRASGSLSAAPVPPRRGEDDSRRSDPG